MLATVTGGPTSETGIFLTGVGVVVVLVLLLVGAVALLRSRRS
ncbi:MAG TPA: hypothetical protein VIG76_13405 [Amnibacterium sp.]